MLFHSGRKGLIVPLIVDEDLVYIRLQSHPKGSEAFSALQNSQSSTFWLEFTMYSYSTPLQNVELRHRGLRKLGTLPKIKKLKKKFMKYLVLNR